MSYEDSLTRTFAVTLATLACGLTAQGAHAQETPATPQEVPPEPLPEPQPAPGEPALPPPVSVQPVAPAPEPLPPPLPVEPPAIAAAPLVAAPVEPTPGTPLKLSGYFFGRYELRQGYDTLGVSAGRFQEGDAAVYRARLGFQTAPINVSEGLDVVLQFTPQASGFTGTLVDTTTDYQAGIHEGYLRIKSSTCSFDLGRFIMDYGDSLVIGNLDWQQTGRAFEGARLKLQADKEGAWVDFFFTQLAEGRPANRPFGAGDQYFAGVYADVGPAIGPGLALDLYALTQLWGGRDDVPVDATDPTGAVFDRGGATQVTLGARIKHALDAFHYRLEGGLQFGERFVATAAEAPSALAYQLDGEVGFTTPMKSFGLALGGLIASGDDPTTEDFEGWDQLYPTAHKFLGLSDIFGARTNAIGPNFKAFAGLSESLKFLLDGHVLSRLEVADGVDKYSGAEVDAQLVYSLGKGLVLRTLYGAFFPNEDGQYGSSETAHYWETQLGYVFK